MLVKEAMTAPVVVLSEAMTIQEAAREFVAHGVIGAPVVDDTGRLRGIVTEIDLLRDRFEPDPRAHAGPVAEAEAPLPACVADVMTRSVVATTETTDIADLAGRMLRTRIRCVPVVSEGRLVGMIGRGELVDAAARPDEVVRGDVLRALAENGPFLPAPEAEVRGGVVHFAAVGTEPQRRLAARIARTVPGVCRVVFDNE